MIYVKMLNFQFFSLFIICFEWKVDIALAHMMLDVSNPAVILWQPNQILQWWWFYRK